MEGRETANVAGENTIHIGLVVSHPLLGPVCGYEGTFTFRRIAILAELQSLPYEQLQDGGARTLDGQDCQQFTGGADLALEIFTLLRSLHYDQASLVIDDGHVSMTLCADGYIHEYTASITGLRRLGAGGSAPFSYAFRLHLWNFDTPVVLTPPSNAVTPTPPAATP